MKSLFRVYPDKAAIALDKYKEFYEHCLSEADKLTERAKNEVYKKGTWYRKEVTVYNHLICTYDNTVGVYVWGIKFPVINTYYLKLHDYYNVPSFTEEMAECLSCHTSAFDKELEAISKSDSYVYCSLVMAEFIDKWSEVGE